jgi:hypothetical protein
MIFTLFVVISTVTGQGVQRLENLVAVAEHGTVKQFAATLARTKAPVGLVVLERDLSVRPTALVSQDAGTETDFETGVRAFEARHAEYEVESTPAGGVLIRPRAGGWCSELVRSRPRDVAVAGEAHEVLYQVYRVWRDDRSSHVPSGLVGSGTLDVSTYRTFVTVNMSHASLEATLNDVVRQVPGVGWGVQEVEVGVVTPSGARHVRRGCNLALFSGDSWLSTGHTLMVPSARPED